VLTTLCRRFEERKWRVVHNRLRVERARFLSDHEFARRAAERPLYGRIGQGLPEIWDGKPRILELGCGDGRFVAMLVSLGYDVVGVDPLEYPAWKDFEDVSNVSLKSGVKAESLPFEDAVFDAVVCMGALLYFEDPDASLNEIRRVLKSEGRLILRTVNRSNLYTLCTSKRLDPASRNLYSEQELTALLDRHGLKVRRMFSFGFWPPVLTDLWWFAANTVITPGVHRLLSALTPRGLRVNWIVFAEREPE